MASQAPPAMNGAWRKLPKSEMSRQERSIERLRIQPTIADQEPPKHAKTDPVQYLPHWQTHLWVLSHAAWPMLLQQAIHWYSGKTLHPVAAFLLYTIAFKVNAIHELWMLRDLGMRYGFLDGDKHERDQVPENSAKKVFRALISTSTFRPLMATFLTYKSSQLPVTVLNWWTPLEVGAYGIILDFCYYWFHRTLHESDTLWKYHRTHHLTKHPTPLLTIYADSVQETFDIAIIPLLTYLIMKAFGCPLNFYEMWLCSQYTVWSELAGHSGVRLWVTPPTTATPFLKLFNAELALEDHDLHHRKGWKSSHNYGKQTRLWDTVFGTTHERIETHDANVQWDQPATMRTFPFI